MDRRGFLALLAGATTAAVSTTDQPSGCDTESDTQMGDMNGGKDYVETFDKDGNLRHTLTSHPSFESVDAELENGTNYVGDGNSIQDTIDALPNGAAEIVVTPDYDESVETLPITYSTGDKPITVRGPGDTHRQASGGASFSPGPTALDFSGNTTDSVFEITGEQSDGTVHNWSPNTSIRDLVIWGGDVAVDVTDVDLSCFANLYCENQDSHGWVQRTDTESNIHNLWYNCYSHRAGTTGWTCETGSKSNGTWFVNCMARESGGRGARIVSGKGIVVDRCDFESNSLYALQIDTGEFQISHSYFEKNDQTNDIADINLPADNTAGGGIVGNRFRGADDDTTNNDRAINANGPNDLYVDYNTFAAYAGGLIQIGRGDDVNIGKNNISVDGTAVLDSDSGTRTRYGGWIGGGPLGGADIGSTFGQKEGDEIRNQGSSGVNGSLWTWDAANGKWVRADGGASVTPT